MTASSTTTELAEVGALTVDGSLEPRQAEAVVATARRFYTFWGTGDTAQLDAAIAEDFHDYTLPPRRPQGPVREGIPRMLDLFDKHDIKVSSFMIGEAVDKHPELAAEIVRRGHEAAAHGRSPLAIGAQR